MSRDAAPISASTIYLLIVGIEGFASMLVFTANIVYQVDAAALSPLQLVLIGTVWEATYFVFEVPTGVVADVYSRRLSVIIGAFISAAGLALTGAFPEFATIALAYVVLGIGGTFGSGAREAWVSDEIGAEKAGDLFLRGSQVTRIASLAAIALAAGLGSIDLQLPHFVGAGLMALLGVFMVAAMKETAFKPVPPEERHGWTGMFGTVIEARALVRRRPVLLTALAIAAVFGAASEGFDRLYTPQFLREVGFPSAGNLEPIVWYSIIGAIQTVLGIIAVEAVRRRLDTTSHASMGRALQVVDLLRIASVCAFAFSGSFAVALLTYLPARVFVTIHYPLYRAWLNLSLESRVRATMLSIAGQADSLGQIAAGPTVGLIAGAQSVKVGLLTAGLMLAPVLPLYSRALGQGDGRARDSAGSERT